MGTRWMTAVVSLGFATISAAANLNFSGAQAIVLNESPHVELSGFTFGNQYDDRRRDFRFVTRLSWKNVGTVPITAFEIGMVKYDAFNRHISTQRWVVTGRNSGNWDPLPPGQSDGDGTTGLFGTEDVYTEFAYVIATRLEDGTVWRAEPAKIQARIRAALPGLKEVGDIEGKREEPKK